MLTYLFKRLLLLIPTFLGITLVTFFMVKLAPGDPASLKLAFREGIKSELLEAAGASREEVVLLPLGYTGGTNGCLEEGRRFCTNIEN